MKGPDRMNGDWDTDSPTDVSSEGYGQNYWTLGDTDVSSDEPDRMNGHWGTDRC